MPRYPGYRFAAEFHRHGRPVDSNIETTFLRVFPDGNGNLRAGLYPTAEPGPDDHWANAETLTDEADALRAVADHPADEALQREQLLVAAYLRLHHDRTKPLNVYVPAELRPWTARFTIQKQPVLLHVQAATDTGARYAAIEETRLIIRDQEEATFNRME